MGRFIETQEVNFINNYVRSYLSASNDYSTFQEGSPTFCDYYTVDVRKSTTNIGLGNVVNIVGDESPIKYNKIENFAIYNMGEAIPTIEYDETAGLDTVIEGEGLVLPDTIIPQPEDMFIVSYQKDDMLKELVFEVNNVEVSSYSSKTFYKINYSLTQFTREEIEERQINDNYKLIYANIGTEYRSLITTKDYIFIEELEKKYEILSDYYVKYFYNRKLNSFIFDFIKSHSVMKNVKEFEERYKNIYDPKLALFIHNNNLFIKKKTLLKNIFIESLLEDREFDYEYTIFNLLEHPEDKDSFKYDSMYLRLINESIFSEFPEKFYECIHNITNFGNWKVSFNNKYLFITNIKEYINNNLTKNYIENNDIDLLEKLIILYIKEYNNLNKEKLKKIIENINVKRDFHSYLLIPCILFIINKLQEKILRKDEVE